MNKHEGRTSVALRNANLMMERDEEDGGWWAIAQTPWGLVTISSYTHHPHKSEPLRFYHFRCCLNGRLHMWRSVLPQSKRGALVFARRMAQWLAESA